MQSVVREAADPLMVELTILERMGSFKRQVCLDCGQLVSGTAAMLGPMAMGATLGGRLVEGSKELFFLEDKKPSNW